VEDVDEAFYVFAVEADAGFFDEVEVWFGSFVAFHEGVLAAGDAFCEFGDELEALGLSAAEGGAGLTEGEVAESGVVEKTEWAGDFWVFIEKLGGLIDAHLEDVSDTVSIVFDFEGSRVVTHFVTRFARDPGDREEVHFEFPATVAFTVGALAFGIVEAET